MTMKKTVLAAALFAAPATAADWYQFATTDDGAVYFADRETSLNDGTFAWVWVRSDLSRVKSTSNRATKELWRFNCKMSTSMTVSHIAYRPDGTVAQSRHFPLDNSYLYEPVAPDTLADVVMRDICSGIR